MADRIVKEQWLYYKDDRSDKVYHACVREVDKNQFVVDYKFGRRGKALNTGTKTMVPTNSFRADGIYNKLVADKFGEGYLPGKEYNPNAERTTKISNFTGIIPQLLVPIEEVHLPKYLAWDAFWAQEKKDGKRITLKKDADRVTGSNRKGQICDVPDNVAKALMDVDRKTIIVDGELVGNMYFMFDLLEVDGVNKRDQPYCTRYNDLSNLPFPMEGTPKVGPLMITRVANTMEEKRNLLIKLRNAGKEGIVFKQWMAKYTPGRPLKGGTQFKFKFWDTASVIVTGITPGKRSVQIGVYDGKKQVDVGSVTIPPNKAIPASFSVIEVQYLYAYKGGSLYQPIYIGPRDDLGLQDAQIMQLKWKSGEVEDEVI